MKVNSENSVWITWEKQTRNRSMSKALGMPLFELLSSKSRFVRYIVLTLKTIRILSSRNVEFAFVQNPSIVLSLLAVVLKRVLKYKVVVDAHNAGIRPSSNPSDITSRLAKVVIKYADLTLVTNSELEKVVLDYGGRAFVLPDPIPELSKPTGRFTIPAKPYLLLICSWSSDEPYKDIILAMRSVPYMNLYITGNYKKALSKEEVSGLTENIVLLGYVSENDYIQYLRHSKLCIDLTSRDDCLVCGGYEAAALNVPCIISDTKVNRETFYKGFVYSKLNPNDIFHAIKYANVNLDSLRRDVTDFAEEHKVKTLKNIESLRDKLISM